MLNKFKIVPLAVLVCATLSASLLAGCSSGESSSADGSASSDTTSSSDSSSSSGGTSSTGSVSVGQKLYMSDGSVFGTVVAVEAAHQFENGAVEPGVLVDYSPRINQQAWLPTRSAQTMVK